MFFAYVPNNLDIRRQFANRINPYVLSFLSELDLDIADFSDVYLKASGKMSEIYAQTYTMDRGFPVFVEFIYFPSSASDIQSQFRLSYSAFTSNGEAQRAALHASGLVERVRALADKPEGIVTEYFDLENESRLMIISNSREPEKAEEWRRLARYVKGADLLVQEYFKISRREFQESRLI